MDVALDPASLEDAGNITLIAVGLAASVVELLAGVALGWWLRGGRESSPAEPDEKLHHAEHALWNVHELATRVKADVGAHSSHVEAISSQLSAQQTAGALRDVNVVDAVAKILESNQHLEQQLHTAESKLHEQAEQIKMHAAHALTDALTGLGNRRAFDTELTRRIAEYQRHSTPVCLMMLDIDLFKKFNDAHGHLAGDEVLRQIGRTLKAAVRTPDFVARYGGEEFGVIMPQTTLDQAQACAERIRAAIEQAECEFEGQHLRVTTSIGVAQTTVGQGLPALVQCADEALYAAKQAGRNRVQRHELPNAAPPGQTSAATVQSNGKPSNGTLPPATPKAISSSPVQTEGDLRTDAQTGLPNRTAFCEDIRRRMAESQRHGNRVSLMLIKVDNLSELIEQHGSLLGDLVLRTCTQFLSAAMRDMDVVARYDTDVFGIGLPGTSLVHTTAAGERLRSAIERCPMRLLDLEVHFSITAGVAEAQPGEDLVSFITRAEEALDAAVAVGGNQVHFHSGISIEALPQQAAAIEP